MSPQSCCKKWPLAAPLLAALFSSPLLAQTAAPVVPDAGSILQQMQPPTPMPRPSNSTGLRIEQQGPAAPVPPGAAFEVKTLQISGNTVFDTATLQALVADAQGRQLTLAQLLGLAARVTDFYRSHGYPLARAIIRAQVIRNGAVRVEVLEAHYGKIELANKSRVDDALLHATLAPLQGGQIVSQAALDRALLLLSDIPGLRLDATLKPGEAVGSSDLRIDAAPGATVAGSVVADDFGSRYTGRARVGANVDLINPLRQGDVLSASVLSSGAGLNYGRLGYEALVDGNGTRVGAAYSLLRYRLGGALEALDARGTAGVASAWARRPLMRSREASVYGQVRVERLQLRDRIDSASVRTDRDLNTVEASLAGDARDAWLLQDGALNSWTVGWTGGKASFQNNAARAADAASARAQGGFSSWHASLARLQNLSAADGLYLSVSGQWAAVNLDSSQKMSAGGPSSVRAYDAGALSGDAGIEATAELRHAFGSDSGLSGLGGIGGIWQFIAFIDSAALRINASPWTAGPNHARLSAAGAGFNWAGPGQWQIKVSLATSIGPRPTLLDGKGSTRAWVEVRKSY